MMNKDGVLGMGQEIEDLQFVELVLSFKYVCKTSISNAKDAVGKETSGESHQKKIVTNVTQGN